MLGLGTDRQIRLQAVALAAVANAIVITDRAGRILWVNAAFTAMSGYSPDEAIGRTPRILKSGTHDSAFYATLWQTIQAGREWRGEITNRHKDGTLYHVNHTITPVREADGSVAHFVGIADNITATKRAQRELQESEQKYRLLFESNPHPMWVYDRETLQFLAVNDAAIRHYGYSRAEFLAMTIKEIRPASELPALMADLAKPAKAIVHETWLHRKKDGTIIHVEVSGANVPFVSRTARLVMVHDVTARMLAEDALDAERRLLRTLIDQTPDYVYVKDRESRFILANQSLAVRMGAGHPADLIGRTDAEFYEAGVAAATRADEVRVLGGESLINQLEKFVVAGGERIVLTTKLPLRDRSGQITSLVGFGRDITERHHAEQALRTAEAKYRNIFEHSLEGLFQTTPAGKFISANPAAAKMLGYGSVDELIAGRTDIGREGYVAPERREDFKRIMAEQGSVTDFQYAVRRKDGRTIWVSETARAVHGDDGRLLYYEGSMMDITEKKMLEADVLRAQRVESVGRLASGIAHDMNNILAPILMAAPLLRMPLPAAEVERTLLSIESSARRGADLVKQLLMFSRGIEGERGPVAPGNLIHEIAGVAEETFPKNISIRTEVDPEVWPVRGDVSQLHQVLLNLCVNARDAMPRGGELLVAATNMTFDEASCRAHADAKPGAYVCVRVADTGTGIPAAVVDKIFDPFFTTKEVGQGTGLGLSTVLGLVKGHGGFIALHTELGRGTTFEVYLPAMRGSSAASLRPEQAAIPRGRNEWILIVDDEASIRTVLKSTLRQHNYNVLTAADGAEARTVFARHAGQIRLVITDLDMPVSDGVTLVRALRQLSPEVRILVSSGVGATKMNERWVSELAALRVDASLPKPCSAEEMLLAVNELLAGARSSCLPDRPR